MKPNIYFIHDDGQAVLRIDENDIFLDAEKVDTLAKYQWTIGNHGYVTSGAGKGQILMHRLIVGAKPGDYVDHINRNKLDNRVSNLRICNNQENQMNRPKQTNGRNHYKGVCELKNGKWQAQIQYYGKQIYLGIFTIEEDAAKAYDTAARKLFGEFAVLNFPEIMEEIKTLVSHKRKLTVQEAEGVRYLYKQGYSISELSSLFAHSYSAIHRIVMNKTFKGAYI